jgi:hypothetical protein
MKPIFMRACVLAAVSGILAAHTTRAAASDCDRNVSADSSRAI